MGLYTKQTPGQFWRPPSAGDYNAMLDAARAERQRQLNQADATLPSYTSQTLVKVRNEDASALAAFAAIALRDPIIDDTDSEAEFLRVVNFEGHLAEAADVSLSPQKLAILMQPLEPDAIGDACLVGCVPCTVNITSDGHRYAQLTDGETYLTSSSTPVAGGVEILWPTSGVTGQTLCYVRLPVDAGASSSGPITIDNPGTTPAPPHLLLQNITQTLQTVPTGYAAIVYHNNQLKVITATGLVCILCEQGSCNCCAESCSPPSISFTWINQGNATARVHSSGTITLSDPSGSVSPDLHLYAFDLPAAPYRVTAKLEATLGNKGGKPTFGLAWRESSSGKLHVFGLRANATAAITLNDDTIHPLVMYAQKYGGPDTPDDAYTGPHRTAALPVYFRLDDDGTERICSYSTTGLDTDWIEYDRQGRTDYLTANQAAILLDAGESQGVRVTICCLDSAHTVGAHDDVSVEAGLEIDWSESYFVQGNYVQQEVGLEVDWSESYFYPGDPPPPDLSVRSPGTPQLNQDLSSTAPPQTPYTSPPFTFDSQTVYWHLAYQATPTCLWTLTARTSPGDTVVATYTTPCTGFDPTTTTTYTLQSGSSAYPPTITTTPAFTSWWKFEESSGTRVDALSGYNLAVVGTGVGSTTGVVGDAVIFPTGDTDRLEYNDAGGVFSAYLSTTKRIRLTGYFKSPSYSTGSEYARWIAHKQSWHLCVRNDALVDGGRKHLHCHNNDGSSGVRSTLTLEDDEWYWFDVTFDTSDDSCSMYVRKESTLDDSQDDGTVDFNGINDTTNALKVGEGSGFVTPTLVIDELKIRIWEP